MIKHASDLGTPKTTRRCDNCRTVYLSTTETNSFHDSFKCRKYTRRKQVKKTTPYAELDKRLQVLEKKAGVRK